MVFHLPSEPSGRGEPGVGLSEPLSVKVVVVATTSLKGCVVLPPGVFETQIEPSLGLVFRERDVSFHEPAKTFRFTVSRTF